MQAVEEIPVTNQSKRITAKLPCVLTDPERIEISNIAAEQSNEATEISEELKAFNKRQKDIISDLEQSVKMNLAILRSGQEIRDVECEIRMHDPINGKKTTYRLDTMEPIGTEKMTDEELQEKFDY